MFHKVFTRMFVTFMLVVVVALAILGGLMSRFLWTNQYRRGLTRMAEQANEIARDYSYWADYQITQQVLKDRVEQVAADSSVVWLVDRFGNQLYRSSLSEEDFKLTQEEVAGILTQVLKSGEPSVFAGAFDRRFGKPVVTVAVPLIKRDQVIGAVFVHRQLETVQNDYMPIVNELIFAAMVAISIGLILISYTAARITHPLRELSRAARNLAKGDMTVHVAVDSDDEISELAQAFNSMVDSLRGLEDMRRGFVANVSHELRSPITSIAGYLQGMLDGTIPPSEHKRYMQVVYDETQRLTRLIRDLLDLSRMESGNMPVNLINFNIDELLRRVLIKYDGRLEEKNMLVETSFDPDPLMVNADVDRIEQVVSNLVDNAIKFCGQYGKLSLEAWVESGHACVRVADDGAGIKASDLAHIFDRFYKADKAHTVGLGTGLGLSISKKILQQHGQDISVTSKEGAGTAFTFTLALSKEEAKAKKSQLNAENS